MKMHINRQTFRSGRLKSALAGLTLFGMSPMSHAALMTLNVQAVSTQIGSGQAVAVTDGKSVSITGTNEVVTFNLYAEITDGDNNHADDTVANVNTRLISTETANGLMGNIGNATRNASFSLGNNGTTNNLDTNPDLEWGSTSGTSSTGDFVATTTSPASSSVGDGVTEVLLGTFTWTLTGTLTNGEMTVINASPFVNTTTLRGTYTFVSDGVQYANRNNTDVGAGSGVTLTAVTPEPASLSLLGLAASGLLMRRRSKRSDSPSA